MDDLDHALMRAWSAIAAAVRQDRVAGQRRAARRRKAITQYAMRPWCLCIRACDTRLMRHATSVELLPDDTVGMDDDVDERIKLGRPHIITLHGEGIRELTKPVCLTWPGERHRKAAAMLGINVRTLHHWIKAGSVEAAYNIGVMQTVRGRPGPHVYAGMPLDPNGFLGRPPDALWGSLWQTHYTKLPEQHELVVERRPRTREWRGEEKLRGWDFVCPGRYEKLSHGRETASGFRHVPCGRRARRLYFPLPVWTIPQAMNDRIEIDDGGADDARWSPGFGDPHAGVRSFACKRCWRVRSITLADVNGWNEFITHVTGGLLYGREVERPTDIVPYKRKHRFAPRPRQKSIELRERIVPLLLKGLTYKQIADHLGVTHGSVMHHIHIIYRDEGVGSREQLREMIELDLKFAAVSRNASSVSP